MGQSRVCFLLVGEVDTDWIKDGRHTRGLRALRDSGGSCQSACLSSCLLSGLPVYFPACLSTSSAPLETAVFNHCSIGRGAGRWGGEEEILPFVKSGVRCHTSRDSTPLTQILLWH